MARALARIWHRLALPGRRDSEMARWPAYAVPCLACHCCLHHLISFTSPSSPTQVLYVLDFDVRTDRMRRRRAEQEARYTRPETRTNAVRFGTTLFPTRCQRLEKVSRTRQSHRASPPPTTLREAELEVDSSESMLTKSIRSQLQSPVHSYLLLRYLSTHVWSCLVMLSLTVPYSTPSLTGMYSHTCAG